VQVLACDSQIDLSTLTCPTGWNVEQAANFQSLVELFQLDIEITGYVIGFSLAFFITGFCTGKVVRYLSR
jgi:hypothetical protein